jgi:hypothetical protein
VQTLCKDGEKFRMSGDSGGYRILDSGHSGNCLVPDDAQQVVVGSATTTVACGTAKPAARLVWDFDSQGDGTYRLRNRLNREMCLTAKDESPAIHGRPTPRFANCVSPGASEYRRQGWAIQ